MSAPRAPRVFAFADGAAYQLAYAEGRQRAEGGWEPRPFEAPRDELARFDPERAGLPRMSVDEADKYIQRQRVMRPWLVTAETAFPETRRIIAAMDVGGTHGHIHHDGWVSEDANMRRTLYMEDPAQLDPAKRLLGVDGLKADDRPHWCGRIVTRITDPNAFVTAFVRGIEHPEVRESLGTAFDPGIRPDRVAVPIADLLGSKGHDFCTGWELRPVDGSMRAARANRDDWIAARQEGREADVPKPRADPVPTFEGGDMLFAFERNDAQRRYGVVSLFPQPAKQ